ncbi:hypothetical protein RSOLAG22IIIB_06085 [Rhizoctonia solani]|uniref:F-box domain-containing protein n=1 Tax=Rhizoctonia solani TaxID=456999 RepID=A0A0K6GBP6_9AGAM|nr:hypothetical protein RSOLAG22IIIB_06085 [Rhizoctonia solani]
MTEEMARALLDSLPNEVIIHILHCCPYKTIFQFSFVGGQTCKRNHEIVANSISLRLHIELGVNGLEVIKPPTKNTNATSSSVLEELTRYRDAWLKPKFGIPMELLVGRPRVLCWELHGGAYFKAYSSFAPRDHPDSLQIIPLDQLPPCPPASFGTKFQKFTTDPGQDLVILVAAIPERPSHVQLHIRSLTTGQPHPDAERPKLTVEFDFEVSVLANSTICYTPEVIESTLAVRFDCEIRRIYEIVILDWKSGRFLHRISSRTGTCASRFISPSHIAVFSATLPVQGGSLLRDIVISIYDITTPAQHDSQTGSNFCVHDCPILEPAIIFKFPKLRNSHSVFSIALMGNSDPVPCRAIYTSSVSFAYSRNMTLGLRVSLFQHPTSQNHLGGINAFRAFISMSCLLDHLARHRNFYGSPVVMSWDQWTEATRWFPEDEVDLSCSQMSGSRYITVKRGPNNLPGHHYLVITDFNTPIVQRHQHPNHLSTPYLYKFAMEEDDAALLNMNRPANNLRPPHSGDDLGEDNTIIIMTLGRDAPGIFDAGFKETIVSRLPCRIIIRTKLEVPHDGWLLDGNHIIGIKDYFGEHPCLSVYDLYMPS